MKPFELQSVELWNFGSFFGRHVVDVMQGLTMVLGRVLDEGDTIDSNTAGKTTLFHAISWCLFGETPAGLKATDFVNHHTREMSVKLTFDAFTVERSKGKKMGLKVTTLDECWQGSLDDSSDTKTGDIDVIQKKLEEFIGLNFDLFASALMFDRASRTSQFLEARPADRAKILSDLIDDVLFVIAAKFVKRDLAAIEQDIQTCVLRAAELSRNEADYKAEIVKVRESLVNAKNEWSIRREQLSKTLKQLKSRITDVQVTLLKKPGTPLSVLEKERQGIQLALNTQERGLRDLGVIRMPPIQAGEACPTCMKHITSKDFSHVHNQVKELRDKAAGYRKDIEILSRSADELEERIRSVRNLEKDQDRAKKDFDHLRVQIAQTEEEMAHPPMGVSGLKESYERLKLKAHEAVQGKAKLEQKLEQLVMKKSILEPLHTGFRSDIRNLLFDKLRDQLHYYTKHYLRYLHEQGGVTVEYPSTSATAKERFDIELYKGGKKQKLRAFSQGEISRISFSVLLALRATMLASTTTRLRLLLVDDPFGGLDSAGISHFTKFLQGVAEDTEDVSNLLVTAPIDVKEGFDQIIRVEKENFCSRFVEA